jgi:hypothetical protein
MTLAVVHFGRPMLGVSQYQKAPGDGGEAMGMRNRCLCGYFACLENLIVGFLYIVIDDTSSEFSS